VKKLAIIFFVFSFIVLLKVFFLGSYQDFNSYYFSGKALVSGINPYTDYKIDFLYPPFALIVLFPLHFLSYSLASGIWLLFSIASVLISVFLLFKISERTVNSALGFTVLGLTFLSFPIKFTLGTGQINAFILLVITLALYFLNKRKFLASSILISLSLLLKLFPICLPIYFLISKKWKILIYILLSIIFLSLISTIILGSYLNVYFYEKVLPTLVNGWKIDYYNQSLTGFVGRLITNNYLREIIRIVLTAGFLISSLFIVFKTRAQEKLVKMNLSFLITLGLIVSNFSWQHHFIFAIIPFIIALFFILDNKFSIKYLIVLFISFLLIALNIKNPNDFSNLITSHVFYGIALLWILQGLAILKFSQPHLQGSATDRQR
jgi:hypothetical protein